MDHRKKKNSGRENSNMKCLVKREGRFWAYFRRNKMPTRSQWMRTERVMRNEIREKGVDCLVLTRHPVVYDLI